jgi:hypothetical protein
MKFSFFRLSAAVMLLATLTTLPVSATDKSLYTTLEWQNLIPANAGQSVISGYVEHEQYTPDQLPQGSAPLVTELNDKPVRLAGFAVPLEGDDNGVTEFLLVPYMGACVHVPPPPSNQIVYVRTREPLAFDMIYDALWVAGVIKAAPISSELAEVGYQLEAHSFEVYQYEQK